MNCLTPINEPKEQATPKKVFTHNFKQFTYKVQITFLCIYKKNGTIIPFNTTSNKFTISFKLKGPIGMNPYYIIENVYDDLNTYKIIP